MNKQELIEKIENLNKLYGERNYVAIDDVLNLVSQLDKPEKAKIPEFVADIIEEYKEKNAPIIDIFTEKYSNKQYNNWLIRSLNAYDRAARAWLDGYEVEEEKRYRVRFKGLDKDLEYLNFKYGHVWVVSDNIENEEYRTHHTRKELEDAGFGWVFDCEGIDVEEVQDD